MGNLSINFGVSGTFRSRFMGQHATPVRRTMWHRDLNRGGHVACRRYGSLISISWSHLYAKLEVRRHFHSDYMKHFRSQHSASNSRPSDLDLWPLNWCASLPNLPTNFGISRTFRSRLISHPTSVRRITWPWPLRSRRLSVMRVFMLLLYTKFEGLPVRKILRIYCMSINRPGDLDFWPLNRLTGYSCDDFHHANLRLPMPFHSRVRSSHGT